MEDFLFLNRSNDCEHGDNLFQPEGRFKSPESSFHLDAGESLAEAFSEEMLKWYADQDGNKKSATLV